MAIRQAWGWRDRDTDRPFAIGKRSNVPSGANNTLAPENAGSVRSHPRSTGFRSSNTT